LFKHQAIFAQKKAAFQCAKAAFFINYNGISRHFKANIKGAFKQGV